MINVRLYSDFIFDLNCIFFGRIASLEDFGGLAHNFMCSNNFVWYRDIWMATERAVITIAVSIRIQAYSGVSRNPWASPCLIPPLGLGCVLPSDAV